MKVQVVYNCCYGGFGISDDAVRWLQDRNVETDNSATGLTRHHPLLVQCVKELGEKSNGQYAALYVHTLNGNKYRIDEYDGSESVVEPNENEWIVVPEDGTVVVAAPVVFTDDSSAEPRLWRRL